MPLDLIGSMLNEVNRIKQRLDTLEEKNKINVPKFKKNDLIKKYRLTANKKDGLYQIQALRDFGSIKKGQLGGWVESEFNLSHHDRSWISVNSRAFGHAQVFMDAQLMDHAVACGNANILDRAWLKGTAYACDNAWIDNQARVTQGTYTKHLPTYRCVEDINRDGNKIRWGFHRFTFDQWEIDNRLKQKKERLSDMELKILDMIFIKVQQEIERNA